MESVSVFEWLSVVEEQQQAFRKAKRSFESSLDTPLFSPPQKRRKLLKNCAKPQQRAKSDSGISYKPTTPASSFDSHLHRLRRLSQSTDPNGMGPEKRMGPPLTPSDTKSVKSNRSSKADGDSTLSRSGSISGSRISADKPSSSAYRHRVLKPNGVFFRLSSDTIPRHILSECQIWLIHSSSEASVSAPMTASQARELASKLEDEDAGPEEEFRRILRDEAVFPSKKSHRGLHCLAGLPFNTAGLPRSRYATAYATISGPVPDFTYGYSEVVFNAAQRAAAQPLIYQPLSDVYWPFLIVEAKSQNMGGNCYQAANQCAAGGTICVNAMMTLLDKAYPAASGDETTATVSSRTHHAMTYSLAVDTKVAELYVHWRDVIEQAFFLQRVDSYMMCRAEDLLKLQVHLHSIVEWGMGPRLATITDALNQVIAEPNTSGHKPTTDNARENAAA